MDPKIRMLLVVKKGVEPQYVALACAHGAVAAAWKWEADPMVRQWRNTVFYKVIRMADDKQFELAKFKGEHVAITESSLDNKEILLAFKPDVCYDKFLEYLPKYKNEVK